MVQSIQDFQSVFFIGIAGSGMSALAQYLVGIGKRVSGSDRFFSAGQANDIRSKLEAEGITCFAQDGTGIHPGIDLVIVSTAVEDTVPEVQLARKLNIPIIRRSEILALISKSRKTIAVAGTSGKSTTSAMLFRILQEAGKDPSIISGAGLVSLIRRDKIGNAAVGRGEWLVIEADESDGSIVQYFPEIGLLLNIDKDHKEIDLLIDMFRTFRNQSNHFSVNRSHPLARTLSVDAKNDFSDDPSSGAGFIADGFRQEDMEIFFRVNGVDFRIHSPGRHNMENALAASTVASLCGVPLEIAAQALSNYEGIYRRHQVLGRKKDIWVIDDYAHNPVKCAASINACQLFSPKVIAWFQPHGYGPTKFLRDDFVKEFADVLRPEDEIWMSEIYYAGGTTVKDISAEDLIKDLQAAGKQAYFVANREDFLEKVRPRLTAGSVLLLMGARDPSLEKFSQATWEAL